MPPRPKDSDEFDALVARVAEDLERAGQQSAAETITRARSYMRDAGYQGGRGAEQARHRVIESLERLAALPEAALASDDVLAAVRWVRKAGKVDREISAKGHLSRRPTRDIYQR
jgi:hypothetical protein